MATHVQAPDGTTIEFPDSMNDAAIEAAMAKLFPRGDKDADIKSFVASSYAPQQPQTFGHGAKEAASGANPLPGLWQMFRHPYQSLVNATQAREALGPKADEAFSKGHTLEGIGYRAASKLPFIGPAAAMLGEQIGGSEPEFDKFGNVVKQGQQPDVTGGIGSVMGTIGGMVAAPAVARGAGRMWQVAARPLVRTALRIPTKAEAFEANPAQMALEHTRSVRPEGIAREAQQSINVARPEMEALVNNATTPIDLAPPRAITSDAAATAARQGNRLVHGQLQPMNEALHGNRVTGAAYPPQISPTEALDLKRGFGDEFVNYSNPDIHTNVNRVGKDVYGNLADQIHDAAPGSEALDRQIQGLIPVKNAALKTMRDPTIGQRVLTRISRPTGGLVPMMLGHAAAGIPGAAAALTAAEAAASPVPLMIGARGIYGTGRLLRTPLVQRATQGGILNRQRQ